MSVGSTYQRGGVWYYAWSYRGRRTKRSSHSQSEAVAKKLLAEAMRNAKHANPDEDRLTFEHAIQRVLTERKVEGRNEGDAGVRLKHLAPFFGGRYVADITTASVADYVGHRLEEKAANASINREQALLRRALKLLEVARMPRFKMLPEDNARRDFLDWGEFCAVREHLPEDLRDLITFMYLSSWRQGQVAALEWRDVDLKAREVTARGETTKNGHPHRIPLDGELWSIVEWAHANRRLDCPYVFHRDGNRFQLCGGTSYVRRAWKRACTAAGFPNHVLHSLRRSGIRNMIRAGVDPLRAMAVSGHRTLEMLRRYDITTVEDQRQALVKTMEHLAKQPASKVRKIG